MDQRKSPYNRNAGLVFTILPLTVLFLEAFVIPGDLDRGYFALLGILFAVSLCTSLYAGYRWQENSNANLPFVVRILKSPRVMIFVTTIGFMCFLAYESTWRR